MEENDLCLGYYNWGGDGIGSLYPVTSLILPAGFDLQQVALSQSLYQIQAL